MKKRLNLYYNRLENAIILRLLRWIWRKRYTLLDTIAEENKHHLHKNPVKKVAENAG